MAIQSPKVLALIEALYAIHAEMHDFSADDFDEDWALSDLEFTLDKYLNEELNWLSNTFQFDKLEMSEELLEFYEALIVFQVVWHFIGELFYDGLFSCAYNFHGKEIALTRQTFSRYELTFSRLVEEFYQLTSRLIQEDPEQNWVTLNLSDDPWQLFSEEESAKILAMNEALDDELGNLMEFLIEKIRIAQQNLKQSLTTS